MSPQEQQARTIVLAQALEQADPQGKLVALDARKAATLAVLQGLKATGGGAAPSDEQLLALRARRLLDLLPAKNAGPALLERPGLLWSVLVFALPLLALLAGMATDRIADPHRVDLLSLPLLLVVFFNLVMYVLLAALTLMRKPLPGGAVLSRVLGHLEPWLLRQRGTSARVVACFHVLWHPLTHKLLLARCQTVLHLSAAAWGAGIALSLAVRGLSAEYRAGWESTFLDGGQVEQLLEFIFWLPTVVFNLTPITLAEVDALRNFGTAGLAGARWVWMYVGLMALLVVLPRLMLAAWTAGSARSISRQLRVPLEAPYFQSVLADMRCTHLAVGLVFADGADADADADVEAGHRARFLRLARSVADDPLAQSLSVSTPEGDLLQWVEEPTDASPVDAVLYMGKAGSAMPEAWSRRPVAVVSVQELALLWPQWPLICRALARSLNLQTASGWHRLASTLVQRQTQRFDHSMAAVAVYLSAVAAQLEGAKSPEAIARAWDDLFLALQQLHCLDRKTGRALEQTLIGRYATPAVIGAKPAAAASAASGAAVGLAIDASTGFITLGAGAALGALLGAGMGWAAVAWRKKGATADVMVQLTEAALLLYLEFAHTVRVRVGTDDARPAWQTQIAGQVQQRKLGLSSLWLEKEGTNAQPGQTAPAQSQQLLRDTVEAVLAALYPEPAPAAPAEIVGRPADF